MKKTDVSLPAEEIKEQTAALLAEAKDEQTALLAALKEHADLLESERKAISDIRTKLRYYKRRIARLEKEVAQQAERDRQEAEFAEVRVAVEHMVTQGMTSAEILKKIKRL